jgi:hypothetical protein
MPHASRRRTAMPWSGSAPVSAASRLAHVTCTHAPMHVRFPTGALREKTWRRGKARSSMARSEHVQVRLRPELKQEIEGLKRKGNLSWQTLVEQLLEAWAQDHRLQPLGPLHASTMPHETPEVVDQRTLGEIHRLLRLIAAQLALDVVPLPLPSPVPQTGALPALASSPSGGEWTPMPAAGSGVPALVCHKCQHTWTPRKPGTPDRCPKCKNPRWWEPRQRRRQRQVPS